MADGYNALVMNLLDYTDRCSVYVVEPMTYQTPPLATRGIRSLIYAEERRRRRGVLT